MYQNSQNGVMSVVVSRCDNHCTGHWRQIKHETFRPQLHHPASCSACLSLNAVSSSSGYIEEQTMPYQNLGSEIILAVGIWLLAIFTFIMMLLIVAVKLLSENWAKIKYRAKAERQTTGELPLQGSENIPAQDAELSSATLEQS